MATTGLLSGSDPEYQAVPCAAVHLDRLGLETGADLLKTQCRPRLTLPSLKNQLHATTASLQTRADADHVSADNRTSQEGSARSTFSGRDTPVALVK